MQRFLKKIGVSLLLASYLLVSILGNSAFVSKVSAQTPSTNDTWYHQDFRNWFHRVATSPPNDVFAERYTSAQVEWIIYGLFAFVINNELDKDLGDCLLNKPVASCTVEIAKALGKVFKIGTIQTKSSGLSYATSPQKGILPSLFLEDRPLSAISYVRNVGKNLRLVPEAKAQNSGFGFGALQPVQSLWSGARNAAYGILVFAILVLSFMIMFRVKINPQTVITVQSAIPKVAIALILITFSYAIAGLMVDLMYVVIGLISVIFAGSYGIPADSMFGLMTRGPLNTGILGAVSIYGLLFFIFAVAGLFAMVGAIGTIVLSGPISILVILLAIILFIVLLFTIVKTIWTLVKAFAFVILLVIIAPLQIALGIVVPTIGFGTWLRSLLGNLAVFPTAGLIIAVAYRLLISSVGLIFGPAGSVFDTIIRSIFGILPAALITASDWPPLLGIGGGPAVGMVYLTTSLVLLLLLPKVSDMIKSVIESRAFDYGKAIGEAVGPGTGVVTAPLGFGLGIGGELGRTYAFGRIRGILPESVRRYVPARGQPPEPGLRSGEAPRGG